MSDLVVVSLEAWDGVWRRNQHLVSRLLLGDPDLRVLFVEPPADPLHDARRGSTLARGRGLRPGDLPGADGRLWLHQPTKWLPRRIDPRADKRLAGAVQGAAAHLGLHQPVLWINDPASASVLRRTAWPALYDITDDWLLADRSAREHDRLVEDERFILEHSRQVVVCSPRLLETKRARRVTLIPNAVDVDAYRVALPRPADLPESRIVLYLGTLHRDRLDVDLCAKLAQSLDGRAKLVLVGPVALDASDRTRLTSAGALLLGPRDHTTVPDYLLNADVLVVPHVVTPFTESLDPIKVYEYLAAARPVVTTPVAGFRDLELSHVGVSAASGFPEAVMRAMEAPAPRGEATSVPSWDDRATAMRSVISHLSDH